MSQEPIQHDENDEKVVLTLSLTRVGQLRVCGAAMADRTLALGLLEEAKDLIKDFYRKLEVKIHKPEHRLTDFLRGKK